VHDDVRSAARILVIAIAEPLIAVLVHALDHRAHRVNATVSTMVRWQLSEIIGRHLYALVELL